MNKYFNAGVAALVIAGSTLATADTAAAPTKVQRHSGSVARSGQRARHQQGRVNSEIALFSRSVREPQYWARGRDRREAVLSPQSWYIAGA